MNATLNINRELNGLEISFASKPTAEILKTLKENGFRWHNKKKLWYAKQTEERMNLAQSITGGEPVAAPAEPQTNAYGVKVGDIFIMSWGYEQTNVDFFQVIKLVGKQSVRIREVRPEMIAEHATCGMAADRTYGLTGEILPPCRSIFIDDQENGDLKRIKTQGETVYLNIADHFAYKCSGETVTAYESWYA